MKMKKTTTKVADLSQKDQTKALITLLKAQPDILQREPKLLEILSFDSIKEGNVTAIAGKQSAHLKKQLLDHKEKTNKLLANAKRYDELTNKIYDLINALLICNTASQTIKSFFDNAPDKFDVNYVEIMGTLEFSEAGASTRFSKDIENEDAYKHIMERMAQGKCLCSDRFPQFVLQFFFGDKADEIKSAAFIPLIDSSNDPKKAIGTLAFGSKDKSKFSSKLKGTIHLERLGKVTALTLERIFKQSK